MVTLPGKRTVLGPAPIWRRLAAFAADLLLINGILFYPFQTIIENLIPQNTWEMLLQGSAPATLAALEIVMITLGIIALLYFSMFEAALTQTPGKRIMDIMVAGETPKPGYWRMLVRSLFVIPIFPLLLLWVIDPLFMLFSKDQRRLLERVSKTRTVMHHVVE